jgi:hypothetical protein
VTGEFSLYLNENVIFENRVFRRIFRPEKDQITEELKKLRN